MRDRGIEAPIVFFTAYGDATTRARIQSIPSSLLLSKPAQPEEIKKAVLIALGHEPATGL
jgi:CheY-like chemotaxis protein